MSSERAAALQQWKGRAASAMKACVKWARSVPFTWVVVLASAIAALVRILVGPSGRHSLDAIVSSGFDSVVVQHHWAGALSSILFAHGPLEVIVMIIVLGASERLLGTRRTIVAYLVVTVVGTALGLGVEALGIQAGDIWSRRIRSHSVIDAMLPIWGALMAASAFATPLLRRRIRVLGFAALLMFLLYSGGPSDLYRLLAAVVGLCLGLVFVRHRPRAPRVRPSNIERRSLLAAIVAITAVGPLITIVSPVSLGPLKPLGLLFKSGIDSGTAVAQDCWTDEITRECIDASALARLDGVGPVLLTLLPLVALLVAAVGILQGRRIGLWLAVAINMMMAVLAALYFGIFPRITTAQYTSHTPGHLDERSLELLLAILVPVATAALLIAARKLFPKDFDGGSVLRFAASVAAIFVVCAAAYLVVSWSFRDEFDPAATWSGLLLDLPERFIPVGFLNFERLSYVPDGAVALVAYLWIGPIFWASVIVLAVRGIARGRVADRSDDRERLLSVLRQGGGGSMAWMTTWTGHRYWFSETSDSVVAYRVDSGVALATGEPVGSPENAASAIREFASFCSDHGWTPVFYSVGDQLRPAFESLGWSMLEIAEETVITPVGWSLQGKSMQDIRTAGNRASKAGIRAEWTRFHELPGEQADQIREISEGWVSGKELPELGFTLGGLPELSDPAVALMLAVDTEDVVQAVTSWLPTYRNGVVVGWTLDVMRRRDDAMPGIMEFVIAQTILRAGLDEIEFVSLSGAPLARTPGETETPASRILSLLGRTLEPSYGFGSLLRFKKKFRPELRPLYLAYPDPLALPAIGVAIARAYAPSMSMSQALSLLH